MPYEPLHHKYRPQTFADLVGQKAIASTLTAAIKTKRIAKAYLLTGPRGTGKTSSARIIAKSLNCLSFNDPTPEPCGTCEICMSISKGTALDVIEMDAASNTGVDNIREIIERVQLVPVQARYKVYVIDECHMLSNAAFNALLKTLEEPPEKVVFILATTDPQRVLPTIISRCQRFDYRRIPLQDMAGHLKNIAQKESINIQDDALALVAQLSDGGLRDAESLLDQLSLIDELVTPEKVWDLVGIVSEQDLFFLIQAIREERQADVIEKIRELLDRGRDPVIILKSLAGFYLTMLMVFNAPDKQNLASVTPTMWTNLKQEIKLWGKEDLYCGQHQLKECEIQLKNTTNSQLWLEITLTNLSYRPTTQPIITQVVKQDVKPQQTVKQVTPKELTKNEIWQKIINSIPHEKAKNFVLENCSFVDFESNVLTILIESQEFYDKCQNTLSNFITHIHTKVLNNDVKVKFSYKVKSELPKITSNELGYSNIKIDSSVIEPLKSSSLLNAAKVIAEKFDGQIIEAIKSEEA